MPRPRKPTAMLTPGYDKKSPSRARPAEPQPSGPLGEPPACLKAAEKAAWRELAAQVPSGVLTIADRAVMEIICRLFARMRADGIGERGLMVGEVALLERCLSKLGMNPSDRSKIAVKKPEQVNEFDAIDEDRHETRRPN